MAEIEYVLLADHAEAANGKLYVMGAGWTDHQRPPQAVDARISITHFGIGVSVLIPWNDTNRKHHLTLRVEHEDGDPILANLEADLEMGRPPGLPHGSDQRAVLALNADIQFPAPGGYRIVAEVGGHPKSTAFRVHDALLPSPPA